MTSRKTILGLTLLLFLLHGSPLHAGLMLWLDAADESSFTIDGGGPTGAVLQWRDKAGADDRGAGTEPGSHFNQLGAASRPTRSNNVFGTNAGVSFDGGDILVSDFGWGGDASAKYSVFAVFKANTPTGYTAALINRPGNGSFHAIDNIGDSGGRVRSYGANATPDAGSELFNFAAHVVRFGPDFFAVDGDLQTQTPSGGTDAHNASETTLGARTRVGTPTLVENGFTGAWAELLVFDETLTATEAADIDAYLGDKWGITVSGGGDAAAGSAFVTAAAAVPEPSAFALLGVVALGFSRRRRRRLS